MTERHPRGLQPDSAADRNAERRRSEIEARLVEVRGQLATLSRGTVAYRDVLSAIRHLERLTIDGERLPPTVAPQGIRHRR